MIVVDILSNPSFIFFFPQAMGRIFVGLCQVGAWGCFDEFNRLEERMLSAVSQQIQTIQLSLREGSFDTCKAITYYTWTTPSLTKGFSYHFQHKGNWFSQAGKPF